jgi:hypothetical protein
VDGARLPGLLAAVAVLNAVAGVGSGIGWVCNFDAFRCAARRHANVENPLQTRAISRSYVLVRDAARCVERILSPARLPVPPLRHVLRMRGAHQRRDAGQR